MLSARSRKKHQPQRQKAVIIVVRQNMETMRMEDEREIVTPEETNPGGSSDTVSALCLAAKDEAPESRRSSKSRRGIARQRALGPLHSMKKTKSMLCFPGKGFDSGDDREETRSIFTDVTEDTYKSETFGQHVDKFSNESFDDDDDHPNDMFSALRALNAFDEDAWVESSCESETSISEKMAAPVDLFSAAAGQSDLATLHINQNSIISVSGTKSAKEVIRENTGPYGSVCFVVRRPGCGLCREDGLALTTLTTMQGKPLEGFGLFGVVKETGVDDDGLSRFHSFFPFPMYRDEGKVFYKAMGLRKARVMKRENGVWASLRAMGRLKKKKIDSNFFKGEGLLQGGLIFFGPDQKPQYAYREETGKEFPIEDIVTVLDTMRAEYCLHQT